jgi:protoporphyrinogen oxidase
LNGYQSVIKVWKEDLEAKDVIIQTEKKVSKILWQNSDGKVVVGTEDGETFIADHVIITVSLGIEITIFALYEIFY